MNLKNSKAFRIAKRIVKRQPESGYLDFPFGSDGKTLIRDLFLESYAVNAKREALEEAERHERFFAHAG